MNRRLLGVVIVLAVAFAGCGATSAPGATTGQGASSATLPAVTPEPLDTAAPTIPAVALPKSYAKLASRDWAKVVKAPDKYIGKGYQVWACITQFDAATGADTFRGEASYRKEPYWYVGDNAFFVGTEAMLADYVTNDIVSMNVVGLGSFSYDTQAGGNTTVPLFQVVKISRKGSCK